MREANHVLGIIHERGQRGLPVEDLYRQLFNPTLYLQAYGKIYRNDGAMTKGATTETVDAMSLSKIGAIIELCDMNATAGLRCVASTSRNPTRPNCARWVYPPGRINCCKK